MKYKQPLHYSNWLIQTSLSDVYVKSLCSKIQSLYGICTTTAQAVENLPKNKSLTEVCKTYSLPSNKVNKRSAPFHNVFPCTRRWYRQSDRRDTLQGKIGPQVFQLLHRGYSVFGQSLQTAAYQSAREVKFSCHALHISELTDIFRNLPALIAYLHFDTLQPLCLEPKSEGHFELQTGSSSLNICQVIRPSLNSSAMWTQTN